MVDYKAGQDVLVWPMLAGRVAMDMAMSASVAWARMAQIAIQSADDALGRYIELIEQEIKRAAAAGTRESVKVE
jgi:hypothetical protein